LSHEQPTPQPPAPSRRAKSSAGDDAALAGLAEYIELCEDAVVCTTLDGALVACNRATCELLGYRRDELLDHNVSLLYPTDRPFITDDEFEQLLRGDRTARRPGAARSRDGNTAAVDVSAAPYIHKNRFVCIVLTLRPSPSRAEQVLRSSEYRLRQILESMPQLVWTSLPDGSCEYLSPQWIAFTGIPAERQLGFGWLDQIHADDRATVLNRWKSALKSRQLLQITYRLRRRDGVYRWFDARAVPLHDADGKISKWFGTNTDVTEQRTASEAMAYRETRLRQTLESMIEGCQIIDFDLRYLYLNAAAAEHARRDRRELIGLRMTDAYPDLESSEVYDLIRRCMTQRESCRLENTFHYGDGTSRIFELAIRPVLEGLLLLTIDVTDRRKAERSLEESARRLQELADAIPQIVWAARPDGSIERLNAVALGYADVRGDLREWSWERLIHPDDLPAARAAWNKILKTNEPQTVEFRLRRADGEYRWHIARQTAGRDAEGNVVRWYGTCTDVHIQKLVEQQLRRSERRLRTLVTAGSQTTWTFDPQLTKADESWLSYTGLAPNDPTGDDFLAVIHPDDRHLADQLRRTAVRNRTSFRQEIRIRRADGEWRNMVTKAAPVLDDFGEIEEWIGQNVDATDQRRLENQLQQSQKIESVGRLAGGIAHDFNNLLTIINGHSALLRSSIAADDRTQESVAAIYEAGRRAAQLTKQLLAVSRTAVVETKLLDLNVSVSNTVALLRRLIGENIEVLTRLAEDLAPVRMDPGQVDQLLMNLVVNARDAMPQGGTLTIDTRNVRLTDDDAGRYPELLPGRYVQLSVSDTGIGMAADVLARIFDPFFTTKEVGKGTGLGLAVVHGIVKQAGGQITVDSEANRGSTFTIVLPTPAEIAVEADKPIAEQSQPGHETILLIEDDDAVRKITHLSLSSLGYDVLTAVGGREALELLAEHGDKIALVVTDVVMPHLGGRQVAESARKQLPNLPVLFMSGYTEDAVTHAGVRSPFEAFLQKPFTPRDLANKVRLLLDAASR